MIDEAHTCPRRSGELGPWDRTEGQDTWLIDRGYRFCSFCGSLHPDEFMAAAEAGYELTPTDKNYKAYIKINETDPGGFRVVSATDKDEPSFVADGWREVNDELRELLNNEGWRGGDYKWVLLQLRGPLRETKFYFMHLSEDDQIEFVKLINDKKIKYSYPGYFYNLPYFVSAKLPGKG